MYVCVHVKTFHVVLSLHTLSLFNKVNVDMGLSSNSKGHKVAAASHVVYRPLEEVVMERSARVKPADQMQIIQRCQEYDPEVSIRTEPGLAGKD